MPTIKSNSFSHQIAMSAIKCEQTGLGLPQQYLEKVDDQHHWVTLMLHWSLWIGKKYQDGNGFDGLHFISDFNLAEASLNNLQVSVWLKSVSSSTFPRNSEWMFSGCWYTSSGLHHSVSPIQQPACTLSNGAPVITSAGLKLFPSMTSFLAAILWPNAGLILNIPSQWTMFSRRQLTSI